METRTSSILRGEILPLQKKESLIHRVFERALSDDSSLGRRVALTQCDGTQITFDELNTKAEQLASGLIKSVCSLPLDRDKIIAVCLHPTIDLIVGLLAIFKTGSAYLPIDPVFPPDRVSHILEDAKPALLLTSTSVLQATSFASIAESNVSIFNLDSDWMNDEQPLEVERSGDEATLAAVLYTSGSTGIPKGVRLEHKTILHRLDWQWRTFPYSPEEVGCFKTALTFVDSISEIWAPLLIGIPLHVVPKQVIQDAQCFIDLLDRCKITRLVLVPSLLKAMLTLLKCPDRKRKEPHLESLKIWVCSGEILTSQLLLEFYDTFPAGTILCNYYGSTEVMGDVTFARFDSRESVYDALVDNKVPIGISNDLSHVKFNYCDRNESVYYLIAL